MFKVYVGSTDRELVPDSWFEDVCDRKVLLTDFSKRMIKEVAGCDVIGENLVVSDVFGPISPDRIGSGCIALLYLMYEKDEAYGRIATRWLGDNLAPYLREIGRVKDITLNLDRFYPLYPSGKKSDVKTLILNTGKIVDNNLDLYEELIEIEDGAYSW